MHATLPATRTPRTSLIHLDRLPFLFVTALLVGLAIHESGRGLTHVDGLDLDVYRTASLNLLHHGDPYIYTGTSGVGSFRYAPWFAVLFMPWAVLPRELAMLAWIPLMFVISLIPITDVTRTYGLRGWAFAALMQILFIGNVAAGNIQPVLITALYFGLHTRWGPAIVGIVASLKIAPILFILPWIARREWQKVSIAVGVFVVLLAPAAIFERPPVMYEAGMFSLIDISPVVWIGVVLVTVAVAYRLGQTRWAWVAAGAAVIAAFPRVLNLDFSFLLPAVRRSHEERG